MSVVGEARRFYESFEFNLCSALTVSRLMIQQCFLNDAGSLNRKRGIPDLWRRFWSG